MSAKKKLSFFSVPKAKKSTKELIATFAISYSLRNLHRNCPNKSQFSHDLRPKGL